MDRWTASLRLGQDGMAKLDALRGLFFQGMTRSAVIRHLIDEEMRRFASKAETEEQWRARMAKEGRTCTR